MYHTTLEQANEAMKFAMPEQTQNGNIFLRHRGIAACALAGATMLGAISACSSDSEPTSGTDAQEQTTVEYTQESTTAVQSETTRASSASSVTTVEQKPTVATAKVQESAPVVVTDEMLRDRSLTCGGKYDIGAIEMLDLSYKFDFFKENPNMGRSVMDITINDSIFGMGDKAYEFALDNAFPNLETNRAYQEFNKSSGVDTTDEFITKLHAVVLSNTYTFINGDCRNNADSGKVTMPSPDIPRITLAAGESVEALVLPKDKLDELKALMVNEGNFLFIEGNIGDMETVAVVLFANGCDNPIRIEAIVPEQPKPPVKPPTSTIPPTTTPPTTKPPTTTTPPPTTGRKGNPGTTTAPPSTTSPQSRVTTTLPSFPSTAPPDTLKPGTTPTTYDVVPTESTRWTPDQPPVTAFTPTTEKPSGNTPSTTIDNPNVVTVPTR